MKNWITALIAVAIIATIFFFLGKCSGKEELPDNSARITELEQDTLRAGLIRDSLTALIDSLETIPPKIERQVIVKLGTIDKRIARDSTQAIVIFREGLQLWNWLPDGTDYPTYRELGLAGKIAVEGNGFKLKTKLYETETIPTLKADVKNYSSLYKASQDLNKIKDINIKQKDDEIDSLNKWYKNRYLWFGLGVVAAGLTVYLVK